MSGVKFFRKKKEAPSPRDAEPHICEECGGMASFGFEVRTRYGQPGRWFCGEHRHLAEQPSKRGAI